MGASKHLSPEERHARAQFASLEGWGTTPDRTVRTRPGRDAFRDSFDEKADPEHKLDPAERRKRGGSLYRAHFARMAFERAKKARLRAEKKAADATDGRPEQAPAVNTTSDAADALASE